MKALVTGGAGFIGSNLVDALLGQGHDVSVIDNLSTGLRENIQHNLDNPRFEFVNGSILDFTVLEKMIAQCDLIYHLAAAVGVKYIVDDPLNSIITNVRGTENVLSLAFKYHKKVVLASTSEIYGKNHKLPFAEDDDRVLGSTRITRWSYSASKAIDEHFAFSYAGKGLPVVILRFFNAYGPRVNELAYGTVVAAFIKQALKNEPLTVHGDGQQSRCFTYIADTVAGIIKSAATPAAEGEMFNIGNDREVSIMSLARLVKKLTQSKSEIITLPYHDFYGQGYEDTPRRVPNMEKSRTILDFNPQVQLEAGLQKTIDWCKENYKI